MTAMDLLALALAPNSVRPAEARWRAGNARARTAGCPCGLPGTKVRTYPVMGSVPTEKWTCDEHEGAEIWMDDGRGSPMPRYGRSVPCDICGRHQSSSGPTGGAANRWYCRHRENEG